MKKQFLIICLVMVSIIYGEESDDYIENNFLNEKIYFPKRTSNYINDLLNRNDMESYYELSKAYIKLGKKEAARSYLKEYEKTSKEYLKIADIYEELEEYEKEIKMIEKYFLEATLQEKEMIYDYIKKIVEEKKIDLDISRFKVTRYEKLRNLLEEEKEYMAYYNKENWTEEENFKIKKDLLSLNLKKNKAQKELYFKLASKYEKLEYMYSVIEDISDLNGFYKYFELAEELGLIVKFKDNYEKLYYLKWKDAEEEYKDLEKEILDEEISKGKEAKRDYNKLYKLYIINHNMKLLFNLALENEEYFYEFIVRNIKNKKYKEILIRNFIEKYPKSNKLIKLKEITIKNETDEMKKIEIINKVLENKFSSVLFDEKLRILEKMEQESEYEKELKNHIFMDYQDEKYIKKYIKLLKNQNRIEELYTELQKLNDKKYFFDIAIDNNYKIPSQYKKELIEYYMQNKMYEELMEYKKDLTYEQYAILYDEKQYQFIQSAREKYPLKKEWMDIGELKYIYFNRNFDKYDEDTINKVLDKSDKSDVEIYYLANEVPILPRYLKMVKPFFEKIFTGQNNYVRYGEFKEKAK
ncbi:MAG: hypothetical protein B6I28_01490 [Fusobacteriia bacterium 4572_132]|nr:MAG: hypothetical protein B6I28_01490 [Fusobacteriia bacterium 4572_132]